jgi:hypothetical protein
VSDTERERAVFVPNEQDPDPTARRSPIDLRKHRRQTERNLILAGFALLLLVGGGLVWLFYGRRAALASWLCLGAGIALFGIVTLLLKLMDVWSTARYDRE